MALYKNPTPRKRFIAGAQCPGCGNFDTVYVLQLAEGQASRQCSRCDFTELLSDVADPVADPQVQTIKLPSTKPNSD